MVAPRTLALLHALIWLLIYGGLFTGVVGYASARRGPGLGWWMVAAGTLAVAVGGVLVWVRSRLRESPGWRRLARIARETSPASSAPHNHLLRSHAPVPRPYQEVFCP